MGHYYQLDWVYSSAALLVYFVFCLLTDTFLRASDGFLEYSIELAVLAGTNLIVIDAKRTLANYQSLTLTALVSLGDAPSANILRPPWKSTPIPGPQYWLHLSRRNLTTVPIVLAHHPEIQWIFLEKNLLSAIVGSPFRQVPNLVHLNLGQNLITSISPGSLANLRKLTYLSLHGNRLSVLSLMSLPELLTLDVSENELKILRTNGTGKLESLDLSHNFISHSTDFTEMSTARNLSQLDLSSNNLTAFDPLWPDVWGIDSIYSFRLGNNRRLKIDSSLVSGLSGVGQLILSHCGFQNLTGRTLFSSELDGPKALYLAHNEISQVRSYAES